jgi:hypothetical protein
VAQGLAIRAGVIMGVDQGKLKDLLLLDVTPKSLGIVTTELDPASGEERRVFDCVLPKGRQLPARGVRRFLLDPTDPRQRFVTVAVYEEVETLVPRAEADAGAGAGTEAGAVYASGGLSEADGGAAYSVRYDHRLMCSYDFPVADFAARDVAPASSTATSSSGNGSDGGGVRVAWVEMTMEEGGATAVRVLETEDEPELLASSASAPSSSSPSSSWLIAYLVVLALLYLLVKLFIAPPPNSAGTTPDSAPALNKGGREL